MSRNHEEDERTVREWVSAALSNPTKNVYEELCRHFDEVGISVGRQGAVYGISSLSETKGANKRRGDLFEALTARLITLKLLPGFDQTLRTYYWSEIPPEVRQKLSLGTQDMGIDLIVETTSGWVAVQCKYRKKPRPGAKTPQGYPIRHLVPWKELSTFYALCERTGPWDKHVVVTTALGVKRPGKKGDKDFSICGTRLSGMSREKWATFAGYTSYRLAESEVTELVEEVKESPPTQEKKTIRRVRKLTEKDKEEVRRRRLARFETPKE